MDYRKKLRLAVAASFVVMLVVNALAMTTVLGGQTTAEVSDKFPTLFTPAGFTFSIWSIIYTLLLAYTVYQLGLVRVRKPLVKPAVLDDITPLVIANFWLNIAWLFTWQYQLLTLSVVLMVGLLVSLIMITQRLSRLEVTPRERLFVTLPFSIYFGWITVATVANISTWLVSLHWDGFGIAPQVWTVAVLFVATVIGLATALRNRDCAYLAVFVWALFGILLKHLSVSGWNNQYPDIVLNVIVFGLACAAVTGYLFAQQYERLFPKQKSFWQRLVGKS